MKITTQYLTGQKAQVRGKKPQGEWRGLFSYLQPTIYHQLVCVLLALASVGQAQTDYSLEIGSPSFTTADPVPNGFVNLANGNLHLEIPLGGFPQRGSIPFAAKMVYDSRIWEVANNGSSQFWSPGNVFNSQGGGWRFATTADAGLVSYGTTVTTCPTGSYTTYWPFWWFLPDGTTRKFGITTRQDSGCGVGNVSSGDAFAEDSTGFHMYVTNYTTAKVYARDGAVVFDGTQSSYTVKDPNGNFFFTDPSGNIVDTLGRTPVLKSAGPANVTYYDVLNSQGPRSRFTVTTTAIDVCTRFLQAGVREYCSAGNPSLQISVIQSITLPDNTSYTFNYDPGTAPGNYGLLTSMTLPTGGIVNFAYTTFQDSYLTAGQRNRWVSSYSAGGGTWSYAPAVITTCTTGTVGCQQKNTMTKPSGDDAVYTFTLNNGAWNTQTAFYTGSSSSGPLLRTVTSDFDFSNACPGCPGAIYIRLTRATTTTADSPTTLTKKTEYTYDSPQQGNATAIKEWNYAATFPATPDRETDFTYLTAPAYTATNIINRVTDRLVKNSAGAKVAETAITYDSTTLTSVMPVQHDNTNYDIGYTTRGNPTLVQQWVSGTTYLSTTLTYDTTGQPLTVTDPAGNPTTFAYSPTFANAYPTTVTNALNQNTSFNYDFNTGVLTSVTDPNGQPTGFTYADPLNRPTLTSLPGGGSIQTQYPSATQRNITTALTSTTSRQDQILLDGLGRVKTKTLASDPVGADFVDTGYDSSGRVASVSNPYRSTLDPTYGTETTAYDGLDRIAQVTRADGNAARTFYGAAVALGGGIISQLCAPAGYPTLFVDEAGKKRQTWTDGLGRTIEVDEPDASNSLTLGTCYSYDLLDNLMQVNQGSQTRIYLYDGLSRLTLTVQPESGTTQFFYTTSTGALCSGDPNAVCRRVAPAPNQTNPATTVTTTYTYDALNRLTLKTYSDTTPAASFFYDEPGVTLNGSPYTLTNTKGRLSHTAVGTSAITIHSYDAAGRVADLWQCTPFNCSSPSIWNMHYTYDLAGDATNWSHPAGFTITNGINTAQQITQISSTLNDATHPPPLATLSYAPQGAISTLVNGCAGTGCVQRQETYEYNNRLQPSRIQLGTSAVPSANTCLVYNYYSNVGNPTSCALPTQGTGDNGNVMGYLYQDTTNPGLGHTASYTYDALNRLATSVATGSSTHNLTFGYDRYGNMTCVTNAQTQGPCPSWGYNALTNQITNTNFFYDAAGNLTQDGTHSYQYDAESRMITVDTGTAAAYTYNALGQRVEKKLGTAYTEILYSASGKPVGEHNRTIWTLSVVPLGGRHLAHYNYQDGKTYFVHSNRLGSTSQVSDQTGAMAQDQLLYPFGQDWTMVGMMQEKRFARLGHRDTETNLDPTPNRMFASTEGRWMIPDPLGGGILNPQSLNRYAYVLNNPTNLTDPTGGEPKLFDELLLDSGPVFGGGGGGGGGGRGLSCRLDGIAAPCGITSGLVSAGAAAICPNNVCSGFGTNPTTGETAFVQFTATAGGASGYFKPSDVATAHEVNGQLLTPAGYNTYIQQNFAKEIASQRNTVVKAIGALPGQTKDSAEKLVGKADAKNLQGGNMNFPFTGEIPKCPLDFCANGLHFKLNGDETFVHLDSGSPLKFPRGTAKHFGKDVILGNIWYTVIPRN